MEVDGAWRIGVSRARNQLIRPWVQGLQEAPDPARRVAVPRHRRRAAQVIDRRVHRLDPRAALAACALVAALAAAGRRGRHEQGDPPRVSGRRDRASIRRRAHDLYSGTIEQAIFETLLTYDYLARPAKLVPLTAEALPQITDERQDLHDQAEEGHLLQRRPGVQGQAARADGRRLRLRAEAPGRSEARVAVGVAGRGQDHRPRRAGRGREEERQVRLRREDRRPRDARPLHAAHPPQADRLQPAVRPRARADVGASRAKSIEAYATSPAAR